MIRIRGYHCDQKWNRYGVIPGRQASWDRSCKRGQREYLLTVRHAGGRTMGYVTLTDIGLRTGEPETQILLKRKFSSPSIGRRDVERWFRIFARG